MKKLHLILVLLAATLCAQAQTIEQVYHYNQPVVSERDGYQQISFQGCLPIGQVGEPTLPWQSVSLMLPQGQEAVSVNVEFADFMELAKEIVLQQISLPSFLIVGMLKIIGSTIYDKNGLDIEKLKPVDSASKTFQPALLIHAINDELINVEHSKDLFKAYAGKDKNLKI